MAKVVTIKSLALRIAELAQRIAELESRPRSLNEAYRILVARLAQDLPVSRSSR